MQTSYEPIQYDETGDAVRRAADAGHGRASRLEISRQRLQETADFLRDFLGRLECISGKQPRGLSGDLATGAGTGFTLVTDHIPEFSKRGLCARDPKRALADDVAMRDAAQAD